MSVKVPDIFSDYNKKKEHRLPDIFSTENESVNSKLKKTKANTMPVKSSASGGLYLGTPFDRVSETANMFAPKSNGTMTGAFGAELDMDYGRTAGGKTDDPALERLKAERDAAQKNYQAANTKRYGTIQAASRGRNPAAKSNMAATERELAQAEDAYNKAISAYNAAIRGNDVYNRSRSLTGLEAVQYTDASGFKTLAERGKAENPSLFNYTPTEGRTLSSRGQRTKAAPDSYYMSDTEKDVYAYWLAKDRGKAGEYLDSLSAALNYRRQADESARIQKVSEEAPALGVGLNVLGSFASPASLVGSLAHNVGDLFRGEETPMDPNSWVHSGTHLVGDSAEGIKRNVNTPFGEFLVDTGLSMAQFLTKLPLGPAALPMMASGAGGQTALEVTERGGTAKQALQMGLVAAAAEYFTEKISLDSLMRIYRAGGSGFKGALKTTAANMGRQAVTEASEEMLSEFINTVGDEFIMGDMSSMNLYVQELVAGGMSEEDALRKAAVQFWIVNPIMSAAGGALSGGVMGSLGSAAGQYKQGRVDRGIGAEFKSQWGADYNAALEELIATGREFGEGSGARAAADQAESKISAGREISAGELGRLWRENALAQREEAAAYFKGESPKLDRLPTQRQVSEYEIAKQQYAYAVELAGNLRQYGVKNVVIEDMPEGVTGRWEDGTVYVSSKLDTAQAINAKVAHEISHAAKEGDAAFSADITQAMRESGVDVEAAIQGKIDLYTEFFNGQGKSDKWIGENITPEYAADEVAADYIGELMKSDTALGSLAKRPGLVQRVLGAIDRLINGKSLVEQSEYRLLANRLRSIAGLNPAAQSGAVSGDGVRYDFENVLTSEVLERNVNEVAAMGPVAEVDMNGFQKGEIDLISQVENFFNGIGNRAVNAQIGEVLLDRRGAKSDVAHGIGRTKAAGFAAVPDVIEKGRVIDYKQNWKNRHYDSAVIAAPVTINGETYIEGVVVTRNDGENRFYLHEVLIEKEDASSFKTGTNQTASVPGDKASSIFILLKKVADVKRNMDDGSDRRFSVEDELTGSGGADIIGDTNSAIETVRRMYREGKTPNEIYNATGKVVMANGNIYSGIGGILEGSVKHGTDINKMGMDGFIGKSIYPRDETGENTKLRVGKDTGDSRNTGNGRRPGWEGLSKAKRFAAVKTVEKYFSKPTTEAKLILERLFGGSLADMAETIYSDYAKSPIIAEQKWNNFVSNISELLQEFDEIAGDGKTRYSVEDELTGFGGADIIGGTQDAIETVRRMHREGRTPNEIYNATGKAVMANGDIFSGIGGKKEGNVNDYAEANQGRPGLDDKPVQDSQNVRKYNEDDRRGNRTPGGKNISGGRRPPWGELATERQRNVTSIVERYVANPSDELRMIIDNAGDVASFAQTVYANYVQGDVVAERWAHIIPDLHEMLREFDALNDGETVRYSVDMNLPTKASEYLSRAENTFIKKLATILDVPKFENRAAVKGVVSEMSEEYLTAGKVSDATLERLMDTAWSEAVKADEEFYNEYKWLKDELRNSAIVVSEAIKRDIPDYDDWRRQQFGRLKIVKSNGLDIDVKYQELSEKAPGLFPEDIIVPADQLRKIAEVAQSIVKVEKNLEQHYGADAKFAREAAEYDIENAFIDYFQNELAAVKKYADRRNAEADEKNKVLGLVAEGFSEAEAETVKQVWAEAKEAKKFVERAVSKNLLTEADEAAVKRLLGGSLTLETLPDGLNKRGVKEVYEAREQYERVMAGVRNYNQNRKAALRSEADFYLNESGKWKDKSAGWKYSRETMERNIRDIAPDKDTADAVVKRYIEPIHKNEAERTRLKNEYRRRVKELELDRKRHRGDKVSEAAAVQIYGEAMDNIEVLTKKKGGEDWRNGHSLSEWKGIADDIIAGNPSLDIERIKSAVESFRQIYDELFEQMNAVRIRNGYEPVDYRHGYFPHFQNEQGDSVLARFGRALGIQMNVQELPATINGLTHTFRPGIRWSGNILKREGFNTVYDAVEGFDRYIEGVSDVICHTDDIQALRAFSDQVRYRAGDEGLRKQVDAIRENKELSTFEKETRIREIYETGKCALSNFVVNLEEYTNLLANKKAFADRNMERAIGRKSYDLVKALENRVAANMVAVNPGSWLTNFIPLTQGGAQLNKTELLKGMWDTLKAYKNSDGFAEMSSFLTNRRGSDPLVQTWTQKASGTLSKPMEWIDTFVADSLVRARYEHNLKADMSEDLAMDEADSWTAGVMADRSKGSLPTMFESKNPLAKLFTQFQLEVNNQLSYLFKDMPREQKEKGLAALVAALLKFFFGAWVYNEVYEHLIGRRPALDPIGILNDTVGDLTGYKLPNVVGMLSDAIQGEAPDFKTEKEGVAGAGVNLAKNVAEEMPFVGGLMGGGRLPISSALPNVENLWNAGARLVSGEGSASKNLNTIGKELLSPAAYLAAPFGGGQLKKIYQGIRTVAEQGRYGMNSEGEKLLQYPVYNDNPAKTALNYVQAGIFGPTALEGGQVWIESGFKSRNAAETAVYQELVKIGTPARLAYETIDALSKAEARDKGTDNEVSQKQVQYEMLMSSELKPLERDAMYYGLLASDREKEMMDELDGLKVQYGESSKVLGQLNGVKSTDEESAAYQKRDILLGSGLNDEQKAAVYTEFVSSSDATMEKMAACGAAGLSFDEFLKISNSFDKLDNDSGLKTAQKAAGFITELSAAGYDAGQISTIGEKFLFRTSMSSTGALERFNEITASGVTAEAATDVLMAVTGLEPLPGQEQVSEAQKLNAISGLSISERDKLAAAGAVASESTVKKLGVGSKFGVSVGSYAEFRETLPAYDADGNGSYKQDEVTAALMSMSGLTNEQKAALWQLANTSWKPYKNPFGSAVGAQVKAELEAATAVSGGDVAGLSPSGVPDIFQSTSSQSNINVNAGQKSSVPDIFS